MSDYSIVDPLFRICNGKLVILVLFTLNVFYILVGYVKLYAKNAVNNKRLNIRLMLICLVLLLVSEITLNALGLHIGMFSSRTTALVKNGNPIIVLLALSLFCLFSNTRFTNRVINRLSGVSLIVYVFHENILIAKYLRPWIWLRILERFGSDMVVGHALLYAICLLGISFSIGLLYSLTLQRLFHRLSDMLVDHIIEIYHLIETKILRLN